MIITKGTWFWFSCLSCFLTFSFISACVSRHCHGEEGLDLLRVKYEYCDNYLGQPNCADFSPTIHCGFFFLSVAKNTIFVLSSGTL